MKEVYKFLNELSINDNDVIIVGVSYGPDSMFLLNLLKNKYNNVVCAHVNHGLRKESIDEQNALKRYCKENNITFEFMKIESYKDNKFTEEEARKKRYDFFESLINKYNSKYLFTAHHGDDLVETVLMRLVRGSNLKGYKAISLISKRNNYSIIRPLLFLTKDYIQNYCLDNKIPFAVDNSNYSDKYTRNRYRNNVLAFLKKENKNVHLKFLDYSKELEMYYSYVDKIVLEKYNKIVLNNVVLLDKLLQEDKLIIRKILEQYLFNNYKNNIKSINSSNALEIENIIYSNKPNISINMPLKKKLIKTYNKLYFDKAYEYNSYCFTLNDKVKLSNGYIISKVKNSNNKSNFVTMLDSSLIKLPIIIRSKKKGDKMEVLGLCGTKKIKDIFIDSKVDKNLRKSYPVVVDSNDNILWLPGLKKSKYDKSKDGKYDIILKYYKEEIK